MLREPVVERAPSQVSEPRGAESTIEGERAMGGESTRISERAKRSEGAIQPERARNSESTGILERAMGHSTRASQGNHSPPCPRSTYHPRKPRGPLCGPRRHPCGERASIWPALGPSGGCVGVLENLPAASGAQGHEVQGWGIAFAPGARPRQRPIASAASGLRPGRCRWGLTHPPTGDGCHGRGRAGLFPQLATWPHVCPRVASPRRPAANPPMGAMWPACGANVGRPAAWGRGDV